MSRVLDDAFRLEKGNLESCKYWKFLLEVYNDHLQPISEHMVVRE